MLFGPDDLWESNDDIIKAISFLSVGVKKNVFVFVLDRQSVYCLGENLIFDFVFSAIEVKQLLKTLLIDVGSVMVLLFNPID